MRSFLLIAIGVAIYSSWESIDWGLVVVAAVTFIVIITPVLWLGVKSRNAAEKHEQESKWRSRLLREQDEKDYQNWKRSIRK